MFRTIFFNTVFGHTIEIDIQKRILNYIKKKANAPNKVKFYLSFVNFCQFKITNKQYTQQLTLVTFYPARVFCGSWHFRVGGLNCENTTAGFYPLKIKKNN